MNYAQAFFKIFRLAVSQAYKKSKLKLVRPLVWVYHRGGSRIFFGGGALVS